MPFIGRILLSIIATAGLLQSTAQSAESINAGGRRATEARPFKATAVASFNLPWAIAFLPDGRLLITEKPGNLFIVTKDGAKTKVGNVPAVAHSGQNGLLHVAIAPDFASSAFIFFSYVEPGAGGSALVLARARLTDVDRNPALDNVAVIWRQSPRGGGGQPGGIIVFDPKGEHLFFTVGDRMVPASAQDQKQGRGKLLRLKLDGSSPADNPFAAEGGVRAQTWTEGHRNPYGLAFAPDGRLWLHEMGPRGGDELNLIEPGLNYGWPLVSNGDQYSGEPIPRHATRPEFRAPALYWTPVIAPAGLAFYKGEMFPQWRGSALIGGLKVQALVRVKFGTDGQPDEAERWNMGARIRDVAVAADGAVWVIEDDNPGRLLRLTPAD